MPTPRLPQPGADQGQWGQILNEYLSVSHDDQGHLNPDVVKSQHIQAGAINTDHIDPLAAQTLVSQYSPQVVISKAALNTNPVQAITAAINSLQATHGGQIKLPIGQWSVADTITIDGAIFADWDRGGIEIIGSGIRGTQLTGPANKPLFRLGSTHTKVAITFKDLTLRGPGKNSPGSIAIDSYTTGGSYIYDNLLIADFETAIREHDNTLVDARSVNIRNCGIGWALGYYSDAHTFLACRVEYCDIGYQVGYYNPSNGESTYTESHGLTWLGGLANLCGVGIYVSGSASTELLTIQGMYFEQYDDVAIRIGRTDGVSAVTAAIAIAGFFNGNVQANSAGIALGKRNHAIEVNNGRAVHINGGGYRNHPLAPINVRSSNARVKIDPGHFDTASAEAGDIRLPDGTYINGVTDRPVTVGLLSASVFSSASALPSASIDRLGTRLRVAGIDYECGADGLGGYAWYALPTPKRLTEATTAQPITIAAASLHNSAGTATETYLGGGSRWHTWSLPDAALTTLIASCSIPTGWSQVHLDLLWTRTGSAAGDIRFNGDLYQAATGDDLTAVVSTGTTPTITPPAANILATTRLLSSVTVDPTKTMSIRLRRDGTHVADTCTDPALIVGLRLTRVS